MKRIIAVLLLTVCGTHANNENRAVSSGISRKTALIVGAAIGFGVNIVSSKYVKPNVAGVAAITPLYVAIRMLNLQHENYVVLGYAGGAAAAKGIWETIKCVKDKMARFWNS